MTDLSSRDDALAVQSLPDVPTVRQHSATAEPLEGRGLAAQPAGGLLNRTPVQNATVTAVRLAPRRSGAERAPRTCGSGLGGEAVWKGGTCLIPRGFRVP